MSKVTDILSGKEKDAGKSVDAHEHERRAMVDLPSPGRMSAQDINRTPVLECRHLGIDFGGLHAVEDFSVIMGHSEIAGLIGPNGAGKTTVFNLLTKVYHAHARLNPAGRGRHGRHEHGAREPGGHRPHVPRTSGSSRRSRSRRTSRSACTTPFRAACGRPSRRLPKFYISEKEFHDRALELLDFFGMADSAGDVAGSLPYGAQRRLEIVRALATNPKLLLLDEPAAGMNPSETAELMDNIQHIRNTFDIAILLIEHDMDLVMNVCEAIAVLNYGKIIAKGTPEEIKSDPQVIEAYLGRQEDEQGGARDGIAQG